LQEQISSILAGVIGVCPLLIIGVRVNSLSKVFAVSVIWLIGMSYLQDGGIPDEKVKNSGIDFYYI